MHYDYFGIASLVLMIASMVGVLINYVLARIAVDDKLPGYAAFCAISGTLFLIMAVAWGFSCSLFFPAAK